MNLNNLEIINALKKQIENKSDKLEEVQQCPICGYVTEYEFLKETIFNEEFENIQLTSTPYYPSETSYPNCICPVCKSTQQERELIQIIETFPKNYNILITDKPNNNVIKILEKKNIDYNVKTDNLKDDSIDVIFSINTLNKVTNYKLLLDQYIQILKNSGKLILKIDYDNNLKRSFEDNAINTPNLRRIFYNDKLNKRVLGQDLKRYIYEHYLTFTYTLLNEISTKRYATNPESIYYICTKTLPKK